MTKRSLVSPGQPDKRRYEFKVKLGIAKAGPRAIINTKFNYRASIRYAYEIKPITDYR